MHTFAIPAAALEAPGRNRAVDVVRGAALLVIVLGHWLKAGVYVDDLGGLHRVSMLRAAEWSQPLTWGLQVVPLLFLAGGFANRRSWRGAIERGVGYRAWLWIRATRLTTPVVPLLCVWLVVAPLAWLGDTGQEWLEVAVEAAMVPLWFLPAYLVVVAITPATVALWVRWRWGSVLLGFGLIAAVDLVSLAAGEPLLALPNVLLVWVTLHQLGYAWADHAWADRGLPGPAVGAGVAGLALLAMLLLVGPGPFATSMVGVNAPGVSNTAPPRVTLALLGLTQAGLVIALEAHLQRLAQHRRLWTATVFLNARAMTVYLWHSTVLAAVVAGSLALGGFGLHARPDTAEWWLGRVPWLLVPGLVLVALAIGLGRFEPHRSSGAPPPLPEVVTGLAAVCVGLAALAELGLVEDRHLLWYLLLLPLAGRFLLSRPATAVR